MKAGSKLNTTRMLAATTAAALGLTFLGIGPAAWADSQQTDAPLTSSTVAESIDSAGDLLAVPAAGDASPVGTTSQGDGTITVPSDPSRGIILDANESEQLRIGLPNADESGPAQVVEPGVASYLGDQSASSVVVADYGVQMLTTIASPDAPTRYDYQLTLAEGQRLGLTDEGLPAIFGTDGSVDVAVAAPWAQDANGAAVPTHYEITGDALTQVVDHTASANTAYPVTADPIWIAPWVFKCLLGLGLKGPDIVRIAQLGTPAAIGAAFGRAAVACIFGK